VFEKTKAKLTYVISFFAGQLSGGKKANQPSVPEEGRVAVSRLSNLTQEKQKQLDALCSQLLQKKELIASGKLQLIGLETIRDRMGTRWQKLCQDVYATTEDVITQHLCKGDVFMRYKGDSYIIIFAYASRQEAAVKAELIVSEIKRRLYELNKDDLSGINVGAEVGEIRANEFASKGFPGVLDTAFSGEASGTEVLKSKTNRKYASGRVALDLYAETEKQKEPLAELRYFYIPLWDVHHGALTTYICMPQFDEDAESGFQAYEDFYRAQSTADRVLLDMRMLQSIIEELATMERENRRFFVICPVHFETLSYLENMQAYKDMCQHIPVEQRKFLIFMVADMPNGSAMNEPFHFISPLKNFSSHVFSRNTLDVNINFQLLKDSGIDGIGVSAFSEIHTEEEALNALNNFCAKARLNKIAKTFVLDISSLSMTTSSVCAGFDYLGGSGIHANVARPDNVYRYKHEDLISDLIKK
jgi:hypothetical protein